jgi:two-component system, NarL family, response regulator DegU
VSKKVLVADDNPLIREALCRMFEIEEDYDLCAEAADGEEAIALALIHKPDLIILDYSMPVMNGLDAARKLKEIMPEIPIILFTIHGDEIRNSIQNLPVDRIVTKSDAALMSHVRSLAPLAR